MSKNAKQWEWYINGVKNAWKIATEAKEEGRDPVQAIKSEIQFRTRCEKIYMPTMTKKEIDKAEHDMQIFTIHTILAVTLMILWEEHNFRHAALNRFAKRFNVYADALLSGSINWPDIIDCLWEECGIRLEGEELLRDAAKRS